LIKKLFSIFKNPKTYLIKKTNHYNAKTLDKIIAEKMCIFDVNRIKYIIGPHLYIHAIQLNLE